MMSSLEAIVKIVLTLSEQQQRSVLDFAAYLAQNEEGFMPSGKNVSLTPNKGKEFSFFSGEVIPQNEEVEKIIEEYESFWKSKE